ncbi:MAG TPA: hypothetical protein VM307_08650 [Egibacteraceae bacterium]|nr:hypothetical protein [Egibacteraceae bacterium]
MPFDVSWSAAALIVGFPLGLLLLVLFLGRVEDWMLMPDERAAAVSQLLEQVDEADELEKAVALMMAEVADKPGTRRPDPALRQRALRLARRRRA